MQDNSRSPALSVVLPFGRILLCLVLASTYFAYMEALNFGFAYDDVLQIVRNKRLDSWQHVPSYFTRHVLAHVSNSPANLYRPLFLLWLFLNNQLFQHEAALWHFATIGLHLVVTGLVYLLARSLLKDTAAALIAALIFGLHPVHVEAVAWISGVTEPLSAAFFIAAFLCYVRTKTATRRRRLWLCFALLLYALAMLAKETAAVLPAVIFLYELVFGESAGWQWIRAVGRRMLPFTGLLGCYLVARFAALHGLAHTMSDVSSATALISLPYVICFYVRLLLFPLHLSPLYDFQYLSSIFSGQFLLCTALLGAGSALLWFWPRTRQPQLVRFLAGWFVLTLAPVLAAIKVLWRYEALHDRYLYLPSVGFAILVAYGLTQVVIIGNARMKMAVVTGAGVCLSAVLAMGTIRQTKYWTGNLALFTQSASVAPANPLAKVYLANELIAYRRFPDAIRISNEALQLAPHWCNAIMAAGLATFGSGEYGGAERFYLDATHACDAPSEAFYHLGVTRFKMRDYNRAVNAFEQAVRLSPNSTDYRFMFGAGFMELHKWQAARSEFVQILEMSPEDRRARGALTKLEAQMQQRGSSRLSDSPSVIRIYQH